MLRPLDEDIWIADASLRFGGIEVGARMTVVRLPDGRILLHSPIAASDALVGSFKRRRTVRPARRAASLVAWR